MFRLDHNIRQVERDLSDAARKQLPFAISVALNETAADIQKNETRRLAKRLDRPTPFTRKAYAVRRATKRRLSARVYAKPIQARYLSTQEQGGTRRPKRRAIVTPAKGARLNRYGNMAKGAVKRTLASDNTFSGTPRGGRRAPGIYRRVGKKRLVKVMSYVTRARYGKRLGFEASAEKTASRRFPHHFERALIRAWKTRRR